jgi:hypothetical protein
MSCSINRFKFVGNAGDTKTPNTSAAKELDARMKEMMALREAQDHGDFKFRPGFTSPPNFTITPGLATTQPSATQHGDTMPWPRK